KSLRSGFGRAPFEAGKLIGVNNNRFHRNKADRISHHDRPVGECVGYSHVSGVPADETIPTQPIPVAAINRLVDNDCGGSARMTDDMRSRSGPVASGWVPGVNVII